MRNAMRAKKQGVNERVKQHRVRKRGSTDNQTVACNPRVFSFRMQKSRAVRKLEKSLPKSPPKRVSTLLSYLQRNKMSPRVTALTQTLANDTPTDEQKMTECLFENGTQLLTDTKAYRYTNTLSVRNAVVAAVSGENISENNCKCKLAKRLGYSVRRIGKGRALRTKILTSEKASIRLTERKTRSDAVSAYTKQLVYQFWISPGISRPTGNKKDTKRERLAPNIYVRHVIHVLEKSQTEVYKEFQETYPDIKISQRTFEKLRPFYVRQVRQCDRNTCCCRYHVEFKLILDQCMKERRHIIDDDPQLLETFPIYKTATDVINASVCPKTRFNSYHDIKCIHRECNNCGVQNIKLLVQEKDTSDTARVIRWQKFDYINIDIKNSTKTRKLMLVKRETRIGELFAYFQTLLKSFPSHQFRSMWQARQLKNIVKDLPANDCVCIHDFSENYQCFAKDELQSAYYQKTEVTIHVTIIHRHSILEYDGVEITEENPNIITEHLFVISDDLRHDHHFVHKAQEVIRDHFKYISYDVTTMHEYTDGCSTQYKSRHCMGDVSHGTDDFGYQRMVRNYFETSHAKGPQDAAGGLLKRHTDLAILHGKAQIQTPKDFYEFVNGNLRETKTSSACVRRIFKYVDTINRDRPRLFKPVKDNRSIHSITSAKTEVLEVKKLSCYACEGGLSPNSGRKQCDDIQYTGTPSVIRMEPEVRSPDDRTCDDDDGVPVIHIIHKDSLVAVLTDETDEGYYLLKSSRDPYTPTEITTDDWQSVYPANCEVVRGHYYKKTSHLTYELMKSQKTLVSVNSVLYVATEFVASQCVVIPEMIHEYLIKSADDCISRF